MFHPRDPHFERWHTARCATGLTPAYGLMSATRRHEDIARKFIGKYAGRPRGGTARAGGRRVLT
jgi:hypothetical protein